MAVWARVLSHALALVTVALTMTVAWPATALERRVALVVGVSNYVAVPHLSNTKADATEIAVALRRLAFDVELVIDPDRAQLEAAVRRLGESGSGADAALFYFAGHGVEVAGRNWLLPVSARPKAARCSSSMRAATARSGCNWRRVLAASLRPACGHSRPLPVR